MGENDELENSSIMRILWWLRLHTFTIQDEGSIPGGRTEILQLHSQKKRKEKEERS